MSIRPRSAPARIGMVLYEDVEPIDLGAIAGVISMARRVLPGIAYVTIASNAGPVRLSGGLIVQASYGVTDAPACDVVIVLGGAGWRRAAEDAALHGFLRRQPIECLASVCTGALILSAVGLLEGRAATTRRRRIEPEPQAPIDQLACAKRLPAQVVDDGVVTGGGVSLAIDTMLYLLGRLYGAEVRDEVGALIEYDRAYAANHAALGAYVL